MKIEKLNENKIKITLDINDLKNRNLDAKSFIYNTPESQDLFWDVMQEAENRYGFSIEESMVYVEAHANGNGMFTLIVTKTMQGQDAVQPKPKRPSTISIKLKRKEGYQLTLDNSIFKFNDIESLLSYTDIANQKLIGINTLYKYNNSYYLVTDKSSDFSILEYSNKEADFATTKTKLNEYGTKIYENNALEKIYKLTHN